MKLDKKDLVLYAITSRNWLNGNKLKSAVEKALKGGADCIQLREKELEEKDFLEEAIELKELCKKYSRPFIINDNIEIAIKVDADGVHIGQNDMDIKTAREKIGKDKILGVSANSVEQAKIAEKLGADYLGVGSVFTTSTKDDVKNIDKDLLLEISNSVKIPIIAIGGIDESNIRQLKNKNISGIAVISAIFNNKDIEEATRNLKTILIKEKIIE